MFTKVCSTVGVNLRSGTVAVVIGLITIVTLGYVGSGQLYVTDTVYTVPDIKRVHNPFRSSVNNRVDEAILTMSQTEPNSGKRSGSSLESTRLFQGDYDGQRPRQTPSDKKLGVIATTLPPTHRPPGPATTSTARSARNYLRYGSTFCKGRDHGLPNITFAASGVWQILSYNKNTDAHLFSAFYDTRPSFGGLPFVRILLFMPETVQERYFCEVFYEDGGPSELIPAVLFKIYQYERFEHNRRAYFQWRYDCALNTTRYNNSHKAPSHVSLVRDPCDSLTTLLTVHDPGPLNQNPVAELGICLALSYGNGSSIENWIEWFEYYKIMGITEFNIYNCSIPRHYDAVLKHYVAEGVARIVQMPAPVPMSSHRGGCFPPLELSLNDCLLRNMYRYRYQAVIDVDEFIVPKSPNITSLHQLLLEVNKRLKLTGIVSSYKFLNSFHFLEFPPDTTRPKYLRILTYRSHIPEMGGNPKSFVNPLYCDNAFNHFCIKHAPPPLHAEVQVPTDMAVLQHYRVCMREIYPCDKPIKDPILNDTNILRFEVILQDKVKPVLKILGLQPSEFIKRPKPTEGPLMRRTTPTIITKKNS